LRVVVPGKDLGPVDRQRPGEPLQDANSRGFSPGNSVSQHALGSCLVGLAPDLAYVFFEIVGRSRRTVQFPSVFEALFLVPGWIDNGGAVVKAGGDSLTVTEDIDVVDGSLSVKAGMLVIGGSLDVLAEQRSPERPQGAADCL
jgi:hypothetical protein